MKCPKCGFDNPDRAKFCSECGSNIEVERYTCPKCHLFVRKGSKFCANCGKELQWTNVDYNSIPVPANKAPEKTQPAPQTRRVVASDVFRYITCGFFFLAFFLLFLGCFGAIAINISSGTSGTSVNSLSYYFGDIFKEIQTLKSQAPKKVYYFELVLMIVDAYAYYAMFTAIIVTSILFVINLVKHIQNKEEIKTRLPIIALASTLAHLMVVYVRFFVSYGGSTTPSHTSLGWGSSLLLAGSIFVLITIGLMHISRSVFKHEMKKEIVSSSLFTAANLFGFISLLLVFGLVFFVSINTSYGKQTAEAPMSFSVRMFLQTYASNSKLPGVFYRSLVGFAVSCGSAVASVLLLAALMKKVTVTKICFFTLSQIALYVGLFVNFLGFSDWYKNEPTVHMSVSAGGIMAIILSCFTIILFIASYVLQGKQNKTTE